jgi:hypothetical protein
MRRRLGFRDARTVPPKARLFDTGRERCRNRVVLRNVPQYVRVDEILSISERPGWFRPSDQLAGRELHPLEIADFHGVLVFSESEKTVACATKTGLPGLVGNGQAPKIAVAQFYCGF